MTGGLVWSYTVEVQASTGRRERRRERVRVALLDAAMTLFAERGLHGTRVEDITDRADLGKGAFYNYFESKDALIGELLRAGIDTLERDYLAAPGEGSSLADRLDRLARSHDRFFAEHPEYVVLFHQARGLLKVDRNDQPRLRAIFADYLDRIGARLTHDGEITGLDRDVRADIAAVVVGAIAGYRSYRLAAGASPNPSTIARALSMSIPTLMAEAEKGARDGG